VKHVLVVGLLIVAALTTSCGIANRYEVQLNQQEVRTQVLEQEVGNLQNRLDSLNQKVARLEAKLTDIERYLSNTPIGKAYYAPITPIRFPKKESGEGGSGKNK
jgi:peptidoglycan hydrolase CwlO-like protein